MRTYRPMIAGGLLALGGCMPPAANVAPLQKSQWVTVQGEHRDLRSMMGAKATVFITMDPDCPICQLYANDFNGIAESYRSQGVAVVGVYAGPFMERTKAAAFSNAGHFSFPQVIDSTCSLTLALRARVTPECFITDPQGTVVYRGALDDRPVREGRKKPQATRHFLADALQAFISTGQPQKEMVAVGCIVECDQ